MIFEGVEFTGGGFQVTEPPPQGLVTLLLHLDGPSEPPIITDSSCFNTGINVTGVDSALTAFAKFGTSSLFLPGGTNFIYTTQGLTTGGRFDLRTGDFTVEGWFYRNSDDGTVRVLFNMRGNEPDATLFNIVTYGGAGTGITYTETGLSPGTDGGVGQLSAPINQWVHWAFVRHGNSLNLYINGVKDSGSAIVTSTTWACGLPDALRIGGNWLTGIQQNAWVGYQDEIRITKGVAVYTSNFTPPNAPFPDPVC